jgi:subtilisin family serine protease
MFKIKSSLVFLFTCLYLHSFGQQKHEENSWHHADPAKDKIYGISTEKAYELLKNRTSQKVIVAVIDGGVDTQHEDLQDVMWVNAGEIPGNGLDDDNNGFIDDVHGWNFLGNKDYQNIQYEQLELTRLYSQLKDKMEQNHTGFTGRDKKVFKSVKNKYRYQLEDLSENKELLDMITFGFFLSDSVIVSTLDKTDYTLEDLKSIKVGNDSPLASAVEVMISFYQHGIDRDMLTEAYDQIKVQAQYHLNPEYNGREIIGDNPEQWDEVYYGNSDVVAEDPSHGTFVAGIIGAARNNNVGIDGIADNVEIMAIRAVPDGDERDKDIAKAIIYAVDNGAKVINMSFGKEFSPQRNFVEEAIRYAASKEVIMVHAAGNDAANIDKRANFPVNLTDKNKEISPYWITVGASSRETDQHLVGDFSNYGKKRVDIFAPGADVYSLKPDDSYEFSSGTSFAAPMVSGIAALLLSYFPELSSAQVKDIILASVTDLRNHEVYKPIDRDGKKARLKTVKFGKLSKTGGIANAYNAVKMADALTSKEL